MTRSPACADLCSFDRAKKRRSCPHYEEGPGTECRGFEQGMTQVGVWTVYHCKYDPPKEVAMEGGNIENISLANIRPNPWGPERPEDPEGIEELAQSIVTYGLLHEPLGRRDGNGIVELACGHRRLAAFKLLQERGHEEYKTIPVSIREYTDQQMADIALQENQARRDIDAINEARYFRRYLAEFKSAGVTQKVLAQRVGISQPELANRLRLLELPPEIQDLVIAREITPRHARALLTVNRWPEIQKEAMKCADDGASTVSELEEDIHRIMRRSAKRLDNAGWPRPLFDRAGCQKCPNQTLIKGWGDDKWWVCMKIECWEKKQTEAEEVARQQRLDELGACQDEVLPQGSLKYGEYRELGELGRDEQCDNCEHMKLLDDYNGRVHHVCINPECLSKKKEKQIREENKVANALEKLYEDRVARAVAAADPLARSCLLAVVHLNTRRLQGDDLREALAAWGQPVNTESGGKVHGVRVVDQVADLPIDELLRGIIRHSIYRLWKYERYWRDDSCGALEPIELEAGLACYADLLAASADDHAKRIDVVCQKGDAETSEQGLVML